MASTAGAQPREPKPSLELGTKWPSGVSFACFLSSSACAASSGKASGSSISSTLSSGCTKSTTPSTAKEPWGCTKLAARLKRTRTSADAPSAASTRAPSPAVRLTLAAVPELDAPLPRLDAPAPAPVQDESMSIDCISSAVERLPARVASSRDDSSRRPRHGKISSSSSSLATALRTCHCRTTTLEMPSSKLPRSSAGQ
eukprot:scaffold8224_cov118-Isochrysis_galbana.AAC.14